MPAHDVTVTGSFSINSYNAVFKIDDEMFETVAVEFGKQITVPEAPEKEGYTFSGWSEIPETMPANDIEITGTYTVNQYLLTYILDGETYAEITVDYGTSLAPEENPEKEGYTFSGWSEIPETMPAHDVTVTGSFSINSYLLTIYLNGEIYSEEEVEFGSDLMIEDPEVPEGNKFEGWLEEIPLTMPAYNLEIHGTYSPLTSVSSIFEDSNRIVTIYTINGRLVCKEGKWNEVVSKLDNGIYIVNGHKIAIFK